MPRPPLVGAQFSRRASEGKIKTLGPRMNERIIQWSTVNGMLHNVYIMVAIKYTLLQFKK